MQSDDEVSSASMQENLITRLRLRVHCSNLPRYGLLKSLPDTFAKITSVSPAAHVPSGPEEVESESVDERGMRNIEWGNTEVVRRSANPQYTKTFPLKYEYGAECYFYVQIYRKDGRKKDPILLGSALCEVGDILGTRNYTKVKRLRGGGCVFSQLEVLSENLQHSVVRFQFSAKNLMPSRKSANVLNAHRFNAEPDTVLEIAKHHDKSNKHAWTTVYRSRPVENSLNPTWDFGQMNFAALCDGNMHQTIRIVIKERRENAANVQIGFCETNLSVLLRTQQDLPPDDPCYELVKDGIIIQRSITKTKEVGRLFVELAQLFDNSDEIAGSSYHYDDMSSLASNDDASVSTSASASASASGMTAWNSERSEVVDMKAIPVPMEVPATFEDYIRDGYKLDFCVAIDFTSSNGDPRIPGTLHYQNINQLNDYEETIESLGASIGKYADECSVLGFGAKFNGKTQHLFQCGSKPTVGGVDEMLEAYKSMFKSDLIMSGPTVVDQILQACAVKAKKFQESANRRYMVLLIITDGIMQDIDETKRRLGVYASVPLSVIFVGIGRAEFKSLDYLCIPAPGNRPNATFCEFRKHQHNPIALGSAALKNVPTQLVEYMVVNDIKPSKTSSARWNK
mmetsp:Transcript_26981/g.75886  ORF Transcript_26981/g.75886 Transcript_26981/m.75886 type:complete len:625 (+) Transcript_26981:141-2015(+)